MKNTKNTTNPGDFNTENIPHQLPATHKREYTRGEEIAHSITHGLGAVLGVLGLVLLIIKTLPLGVVDLISGIVFGVSLIFLYTASGSFHGCCARFGLCTKSRIRDFFMKCDHSMIYLLILGTYTPACLSAMGGVVGWLVFGVVAACCTLGAVLNIIDVDRFLKISLVLYLVTGWTIILASVSYYKAVGKGGFLFLVLGGISYTVGVIFYKLQRIKYMHIIWHILVLGGSVLHYIMVYGYCYN